MVGVDREVRRVDVVALQHHLENLRLVHCAFLHKVDDLVLVVDRVIHIVVELSHHLVLQLAGLGHEVLVFRHEGEVFTIFSQQIELGNMCPREVAIAHGVHRPNSDVLTTTKQVHLVNFAIKRLPVLSQRHPGEAVRSVEDRERHLPFPHERINEEQVPTQRHRQHVGAIRVLQVDLRVLDIITRPKEHLTLAIELKSLRRLIDFVSSLQILLGTLFDLSVSRIDDLVQVMHLAEVALLLHWHH